MNRSSGMGNVGYSGDSFVAAPCSSQGCDPTVTLAGKTIRGTAAYMVTDWVDTGANNIRVDTFGSLIMQAGNKVTLRPGFRASFNSYVRAVTQNCNNVP